MLINTITFEIADFTNKTIEEFLIENTIENQEKVLSHRYTRSIRFTQTFDFQFEKEQTTPIEFIEMDIWVRLINTQPELFDAFLIEA